MMKLAPLPGLRFPGRCLNSADDVDSVASFDRVQILIERPVRHVPNQRLDLIQITKEVAAVAGNRTLPSRGEQGRLLLNGDFESRRDHT